jgi:hypothetical protein
MKILRSGIYPIPGARPGITDGPATYPVTSFQNQDIVAFLLEITRGPQTGNTGANNDDFHALYKFVYGFFL